MKGWKECKLGDLITLEYGRSLRDYRKSTGKYPVYGTNGKIGSAETFLSLPSIIIGRKGAYRGIHFSHDYFYVIDTAFYVKQKTANIDLLFLYNFLLTQDINAMDSGSAIPSTDRYEIYDIDISLPPLSEQQAIAGVLSSLDDKIDLLHRQNKTLEGMAEALWRKMFVEDADPVIATFGEIADLYDSKRIPLSSIQRDKMKDGDLYPYYGAAKIMDYINQYIFEGEYLLLGEDGTVQTADGFPILQLATGKFWVNNHTHVIKAKKPFTNFMLYIILRKMIISHIVTGAVQPKINQENLKSLEIEMPSKSRIEEVSFVIDIMWQKIQGNNSQIRIIENLRDILLPKLINGELEIK